ncbi:MAG: glutamine synthetase family protein [Marinobacterium sp.]|nr:glutamine synthetase family protein [Marinobacterium sp.]
MSSHQPVAEVDSFLASHPDTEAVDLLLPDINGVVRGKRIERNALSKVFENGVAMPASVFSLDITGNTIEECGLGLEIGEPDRPCLPVAGSLTTTPWQKRPMAQLLMNMYEGDGSPFFGDPRHVLARQLEHIRALGLTPVVAVELEFYLIDQNRDQLGKPQPPISPKTGQREGHTQVYSINDLDSYDQFLHDIADYTAAQGIPADTAVAENAPGQFEINLKHQDDPLAACDNAILLKRVIKAVAEKHGMEASFMARPYEDEAGNGLHIHISMLDEQGHNIFSGDSFAGDSTSGDSDKAREGQIYSKKLEHAVGGLLDMMADSMAIFCPNVNSYRRLQPGYYVAMAPTWGVDNRTVAVRIPAGPANARRIEHRISGADANPYLVMAALLAGVHHGLTSAIEPPAPVEGNAFATERENLPNRMPETLARLRSSELIEHYFGADFVNLYATCKEAELAEFERHVTTLETRWFLSTL